MSNHKRIVKIKRGIRDHSITSKYLIILADQAPITLKSYFTSRGEATFFFDHAFIARVRLRAD